VLKATKASLEAEVAQLKSTLSSLDAALHSAAADGTVNDTAAEPGSSNHQSSSKQNEHLEQLFKLVGLQLNENRGKDRKAFAKSLFESQMARWDKDNDGLITKSEFEAVFARQDHNKDGAVSRDEFARCAVRADLLSFGHIRHSVHWAGLAPDTRPNCCCCLLVFLGSRV
jgi:hypothetical protein